MQNQAQDASGITKNTSKSAISINSIKATQYQKDGTETAELKQVLTTVATYPSKRVGSEMSPSMFAMSDFGFEGESYTTTETRIGWIDVPVGISPEDVLKKIEENKGVLYKVLSNRPIITSNQKYAIANGQRTLADFANRQVVRFPKEHATTPNQIIKDKNGKVQYKAVFFYPGEQPDMDLRTPELDDVFVSPEIQAELTGSVVATQATVLAEDQAIS